MKRNSLFAAWLILIASILAPIGQSRLAADTPSASSLQKSVDPSKLTGSISTIGKTRVLTLWGTPEERGFAHGYLLADDIVNILDGYLRHSVKDPAVFEKQAKVLLKVMTILPRYQNELHGMLDGIHAKLGPQAPLKIMNRPLNYDDLMALICIPELARVGCSSFAAWGPMTRAGETLSGRNLDWFKVPVLDGKEIIIVNKAQPDQNAEGWVSISWPGFIGCLTGMNSEGVTVSMHDVYTDGPSVPLIFTPRGMALREAIEAAHADSAIEDVHRVLRKRFAMVGNNVPISFPWKQGMRTAAAVFEYDSRVSDGMGVTLRVDDGSGGPAPVRSSPDDLDRSGKKESAFAEKSEDYLLCTNHYRSRGHAENCDRYAKFKNCCERDAAEGSKLDIKDGWDLLRRVECSPGSRIRTYHSVIFEPNKKRMHVAFADGQRPAAECEPITLNVDDLLKCK